MSHRLFLIPLCLVPLLFAGCEKDNITDVTPTGQEDNTDSGDDNIANTTFDGTVSVVFSSGGATVSGATDNLTVTTDGNGVTIVNSGSETLRYELSGSTVDGFFKLYSGKKQAIVLNSVGIANPNGAAINVQGPQANPSKGKRTFVVVSGTNSLADGSTYSGTPADEDEKAVFFSEGQLIFSGDGSLSVAASGKSGITSDDYVRFLSSPTVTVYSSAGHGIRGKDYVLVSDGTLDIRVSANTKKGITSDSLVCFDGGTTTINITGGAAYDSDDSEYKGTAGVKADQLFVINGGSLTVTNSGNGGKGISGDAAGLFNGGTVSVTTTGSNYTTGSVSAKGIKFDGDLTFNGGKVTVNCKAHEGIESKGTITVNGGEIYSYSAADDAINSASNFTINDGFVCGYAVRNDGLDANGNFYIKGGVVYAIGARSPEVAVDANTEGGYKLYVQGGVIIAIGGLERGSSLTQSCYSVNSWSKSVWYALTVGETTYAFKTPSSGGTPLVVSGGTTKPTLQSGVTVSDGTEYFEGMMNIGGTVSGGTDVSLSNYTGSGGGWH